MSDICDPTPCEQHIEWLNKLAEEYGSEGLLRLTAAQLTADGNDWQKEFQWAIDSLDKVSRAGQTCRIT